MAFGLSPHIICIATMVGGIAGIFITVYLGVKIKALIAKYRKKKPGSTKKPEGKYKLLHNLWHKYDVFGIGFIGTFLVGAILSIGPEPGC